VAQVAQAFHAALLYFPAGQVEQALELDLYVPTVQALQDAIPADEI
jgi:hypothetical protein